MIHDRHNLFKVIRQSLQNIAGRNFWPNSSVQLALPDILKNTPQEYFDNNAREVQVRIKHFGVPLINLLPL